MDGDAVWVASCARLVCGLDLDDPDPMADKLRELQPFTATTSHIIQHQGLVNNLFTLVFGSLTDSPNLSIYNNSTRPLFFKTFKSLLYAYGSLSKSLGEAAVKASNSHGTMTGSASGGKDAVTEADRANVNDLTGLGICLHHFTATQVFCYLLHDINSAMCSLIMIKQEKAEQEKAEQERQVKEEEEEKAVKDLEDQLKDARKEEWTKCQAEAELRKLHPEMFQVELEEIHFKRQKRKQAKATQKGERKSESGLEVQQQQKIIVEQTTQNQKEKKVENPQQSESGSFSSVLQTLTNRWGKKKEPARAAISSQVDSPTDVTKPTASDNLSQDVSQTLNDGPALQAEQDIDMIDLEDEEHEIEAEVEEHKTIIDIEATNTTTSVTHRDSIPSAVLEEADTFCDQLGAWVRVLVMHIKAAEHVIAKVSTNTTPIQLAFGDFTSWDEEPDSECTLEAVLQELGKENSAALQGLLQNNKKLGSTPKPFSGVVHCEAQLAAFLVQAKASFLLLSQNLIEV